MSRVMRKLTHFFQPTISAVVFATLARAKISDIRRALFDRNFYFMNIFNRDTFIEEIFASF